MASFQITDLFAFPSPRDFFNAASFRLSVDQFKAGFVQITAKAVDVAATKTLVTPEVQDSGIGMSDATLGQSYQPFTQADATISGQYGGSGLGLSIIREGARLMEGDVQIASRLGEGSAVFLAFPSLPYRPTPTSRIGTSALPQEWMIS